MMNYNPIVAMLNQKNQTVNPFVQAFQSVSKSQNPEQALAQYIQNSPQGQEVMSYIQNNGGNAKNAFYNLAQQKGIDPESILSMFR